MAGIVFNTYSATQTSATLRFMMTTSSSTTSYRVRCYVNQKAQSYYSSGMSGSTTFNNVTVSVTGLTHSVTYAGTAYLQYYDDYHSEYRDSGYTCSVSFTTASPPSYSGSFTTSAVGWLKNSSYPSQGVAKAVITTSGASSGFYLSVGGYVRTMYSDSACTTVYGTTFGALSSKTLYYKLDYLYDGDTSDYYQVNLYSPSDTLLKSQLQYHQAYKTELNIYDATQTTMTFSYGISEPINSSWRLRLSDGQIFSMTSNISTHQFTGLSLNTQYTCYLERRGSGSIWDVIKSYSYWTDPGYTVTIQYATTSSPSVIFETGTVSGFSSGAYFTQTHIITNMASKSSLNAYSYSSCDHTLPFQVTSSTTIRAYVELKHNTITYYKNDGSSSSLTQSKVYNVAATLKNASAFSRTGYTLVRWNTKSDGSGTNYALGASYNYNVDLTLYAVWQPNSYNVNLYYYSREPGEDVYSHLVTITQGVIYNYQYTENLLMSILSGRGYSGYRFEDSNPNMPYNITSDSSIYIYLLHSSRTIDKFYFHRNSSASSDVDRNYIYSGAATTNLTTAKFNELFSKIHEVERAVGRTETSFTDLTSKIRAVNINETATAIRNLPGSGSVTASNKQTGGIVYASYFVGNNTTSDTSLKAALNRAIDDYNT